jgi:hypothetical protein
MKCRTCGIEIADRAIVCYRCGTPTAERTAGARRPVRRPRLLPAVIAFVVLVLAALFMSRAALGETPRALGWTLLALAAVVVVWRLLARRGPPPGGRA